MSRWSLSTPLEYASRVPSGDQAGPSSHSVLRVSWVGLEPSAFMIQISLSPPGLPPFRLASLSNAILLPSGDQAGAESNDPTTSNSVVRPVPSTFSVWIARSVSPVGEVVVANSTLLMSGDRLGYHLHLLRWIETRRAG